MEYLQNSTSIRKKLKYLFADNSQSLAIVAFVGANARKYLPKDLSRLRVVCWPKAGGTNPDGVRELINSGATVLFCNRLHSKFYYSSTRGVIIGSANLSDNALGDDSLHEFAVYESTPTLDINRIVANLGRLSEANEENLSKLQLEHDLYNRRNPSPSGAGRTIPTFLEASEGLIPRKWKIVSYSEERDDEESIRKAVKSAFGQEIWINDNDVKRNTYSVGDIVLQIETNSSDIIVKPNARWLYVDHISKRRGGETIIQVHKASPALAPFAIDVNFKRAFMKAFNPMAWNYIVDEKSRVRSKLLENIRHAYAGDA